LWNIAVNKLLRILEGGGCKVVAYADDVAIIFNGKYPKKHILAVVDGFTKFVRLYTAKTLG